MGWKKQMHLNRACQTGFSIWNYGELILVIIGSQKALELATIERRDDEYILEHEALNQRNWNQHPLFFFRVEYSRRCKIFI
jgi:hypothetical protein